MPIHKSNVMHWSFFRIATVQAFRYKEQAIIKILGLVVGIAICLLIFLIVRFETGFDDFHPNRDHIYRVVSVFKTPEGIDYETGVPFPTAPTLRLRKLLTGSLVLNLGSIIA
jgi:putative ABC transport system permease protein